MEKITSYLGLFALLIYAYLIDYGISFLQMEGIQSFVLTPYLAGNFVANLLLAIGVLGLFWLLQIKRLMNRITGLVFILFGLIVMSYPLVAGKIPGLMSILHTSLLEIDSKLSITSAFVVIMGLWGLFSPNQSSIIKSN